MIGPPRGSPGLGLARQVDGVDNVLIHPGHADAKRIRVGVEAPIWWDEGLFAAG